MSGYDGARRGPWARSWARVRRKWLDYIGVASRLFPYLSNRRGSLLLALVLSLAFTLARLLEPWTIKLIIDNVLLGRPLPGFVPRALVGDGPISFRLLYVLVAAIVLLAAARGFLYYRRRLLVARLGIGVTSDLRIDLYRHLQQLSPRFHDRRRTGDLIVRLTSDIRMLRQAFVSLPLELSEGLLLMGGMSVVLLLMDWRLALPALLLLPAIAFMVRRYQRPMRNAIRKQRQREGQLATLAAEALGSIRVVQAFRRERHEVKRFGGASRKDMRSGLRASRLEAKLKWSSDLSVALITALITLLASRRILQGTLSVGDLIVFISYLRIFSRPLQRVSRILERMMRATAAGERVLRILATESSVRDLPSAVRAPGFRGDVRFEGVSFAYEGRRAVLNEINLHVKAGEKIGILGATGAGKSTLVSLIPRFYDPGSGIVRIDGQDVRGFTLQSLRKQIALVFQEPLLMGTSVAENIGYGKPGATTEDILKAARRARVHRIIERLHEGYETIIGERGCRLSGGQRQCIAIARAMIGDAPILVLDEPMVGLDPRSASLVRRALQRLIRRRTVLLITHDARNLDGMDRVIRMERGRIVEESDSPAVRGLREARS